MSTAIIELNDSGILCHAGTALQDNTSSVAQQIVQASPGYALLQPHGVITGQQALQQAWLHPQQSFNQYWYQLSLSPLSISNEHARHHADLAYAQLQQLYADADKPRQMIFAMPGNTTAEHLAILLGLVKASPFNAAGLVDAAVAAASQAGLQGKLVHADIQLHTTVLSQLNSASVVARETVSQYPDISLKTIYDIWAQFIADRFIREYRYDPLHTAAGEQQLRDRLPDWINQLNSQTEIETELSAPQGNFRLRLQRSEFIAANQQRWQRLVEALADKPFDYLLLSHRLANLPGVIAYLKEEGHNNIVTLAVDATIAACLAQSNAICDAVDNKNDDTQLSFITALPTLSSTPNPESPPASSPQNSKGVASHLLQGHRAYALAQGLVLLGDGTPSMTGKATKSLSSQPAAEINAKEGRIVLHQRDNSVVIRCDGDWHNLRTGDVVFIAGQTLTLIEVG